MVAGSGLEHRATLRPRCEDIFGMENIGDVHCCDLSMRRGRVEVDLFNSLILFPSSVTNRLKRSHKIQNRPKVRHVQFCRRFVGDRLKSLIHLQSLQSA